MLALPIATASGGFLQSVCWLLAFWALMSFVGLYTVEANTYYGEGLSVAAMAERTLGRWAKWLTSTAILLLFYALLSAYIAGGSSLLTYFIPESWINTLPPNSLPVLYTLVLGGFIYACTQAVDYLNRLLFFLKLVVFGLLVLWLLPKTKMEYLITPEANASLFLVAPLLFTSFGFHGSLPALFNYVGKEQAPSLSRSIWIGCLFPLVFYIIWEAVSLGTLPLKGLHSFESVANTGGDVGAFLSELNAVIPGTQLSFATSCFTILAIVTSFLGVALGLFDFVSELGNIPKHKWGRMLTTLLTLTIPLFFSIRYPQGFIAALGLAAIALSIIAIIMPTCIVYKLRQITNYSKKNSYIAPGGSMILWVCFFVGILLIGIEVKSFF